MPLPPLIFLSARATLPGKEEDNISGTKKPHSCSIFWGHNYRAVSIDYAKGTCVLECQRCGHRIECPITEALEKQFERG